MMGDFKDIIGNRTGSEVVGPYGKKRVKDNGERLIVWAVSFEITNGIYPHIDIYKYIGYKETLQQRSMTNLITPWLMKPGCSMLHSQELSNKPYPYPF